MSRHHDMSSGVMPIGMVYVGKYGIYRAGAAPDDHCLTKFHGRKFKGHSCDKTPRCYGERSHMVFYAGWMLLRNNGTRIRKWGDGRVSDDPVTPHFNRVIAGNLVHS